MSGKENTGSDAATRGGSNENGSGQSQSCTVAGGCAGLPVPRREFLKVSGVGLVATTLGGSPRVMAGTFSHADLRDGHLVPVEKKLSKAWVRALFQRGKKEVYRGKALGNIGMPCGGIGAGQLYLCGDGTLGAWEIFNHAESKWVANTHSTYTHHGFAKPVAQGLAVVLRSGNEKPIVRELSRRGFKEISFKGEYPIGTVQYASDDVPVRATLEAFSPFIPLNMNDSGMPATLLHVTIENRSDRHLHARVLGWLENAVCCRSAGQLDGTKVTQIRHEDGRGMVMHSVRENRPATKTDAKPPTVFADFESGSYDRWTVAGAAFGKAPAAGTLPHQQPVTGFAGHGLVNSFVGGDRPHGKMISPSFTIDRPFINLKIGGGSHRGKTCVLLVVDGKAVRSATGRATEKLQWTSWYVGPLKGKNAHFEIVDQASGGWGHILVDQIELSDTARVAVPVKPTQASDYGTMALACGESAVPVSAAEQVLPNGLEGTFVDQGRRSTPLDGKLVGLVRSSEVSLGPGQKKTFTFVLTWHFPNTEHGHAYAVRFPDAAAVATYVLDHHDRLAGQTRLWRDTYYDSSLPYWLLDRLHSTVSTLATGTCQWWANRRFYAYEGVTCCTGTCTHVWNYAHAHARLFPELGRSIRAQQDFCLRRNGGGFHPDTGLVGFRGNDAYAADGQCGTILKALREHMMSADDGFLRMFWPRIKKALEFSIAQDGNADGLIENSQHNTYDINYEGPNTFVGALYLAALRAGEQMAREVGDEAFANQCRAIFERGRQQSEKRLWNGEYFVQDVDLTKYPKHQYGQGCLSDQVFGQGWAHQVGLGYIYSPTMVRSALQAVWKYNWTPDVTPYNNVHKPLRWFISPGQAGLLTCTWPKSEYLSEGTLYKNEVWTGIEYQVAGHMIAEGMVTEGLAICRAVHDRYQPALMNPYNEVECGDHYARAMASWGVYLALAGFAYHGPKGHLAFAPRITPERFQAAFTAADGWGTFEQARRGTEQIDRVTVRWGTLRLKSLALAVPEATNKSVATVTVAGKPVPAGVVPTDQGVRVTLTHEATLREGETIAVQFAGKATAKTG